MLTLCPTGLSSPAYRDWLDYIVLEDGRAIGRMYEDRHAKPELRWFWSITDYIKPEPRNHHERARSKVQKRNS